ncbi:MAG: von Willebrand factor type A domain-containing protein [Candidatus Eisenbacteria bacterium]|uniref:von Willebrand factor type A domain-containing protein n=1 Tax=Eiseniibacteriota bacterium TaxID=2212470 RepID=A0A948RWI2_UNCEI|nr:von Willebrand factor type A domain-containing protein [Candidatus Eisenbacteria bacterium]MBU1950369.1 von Willebrand factor type A domain-containing protein [Candidatus Eisenbacteria bacterium]MBU2689554.1 von Willebrand factor type A domain-containing protein [Candidatus Eisenbacteria bacterium]
MKRDLDRYKDKLTPEEERRIWGRMRSALHEDRDEDKSWRLGLWLSRAAIVAGTAMLAVAIWRAGSPPPNTTLPEAPLQPDRYLSKKMEPKSAPGIDAPAHDDDNSLKPDGILPIPGANQLSTDARSAAPPMEAPEIYSEMKATRPSDDEIIAHRERQPIMLADAGEIRGSVFNEYGEPMPFIKVTLNDTPWGTIVQDDGSFRIRNLPAGNYTLSVMEAGYHEVNLSNLNVKERELLELNVALETDSPYGRICGRILNSAGEPVAGARVQVLDGGGRAVTADDGSFCITDVSAGRHRIYVSARDYQALTLEDIDVERGLENDLVANLTNADVPDKKSKGKKESTLSGGKLHYESAPSEEAITSMEIAESEQVASSVTRSDQVRLMEAGGSTAGESRYGSATGGLQPVNDELADDMFFKHYGVNPFVAADEDALSTFGLDVDTGSYTIARNYIRKGKLPPQEAIRVEEFVNFVRKNYDPPEHDDFSIRVDGMPSPFAPVQDGSYQLVRVGIRGRVVDSEDREAVQVVLVIDTSGSMRSENRIELLKSSMDILLDELRPDDELGIVAFSNTARVVLPMTSLKDEEKIHRAIHSLQPNGSTNVEQGLEFGYAMLREAPHQSPNQRIILCSDGVANEGNTGWEKILENVKESSDRIMLSSIGFGMGNYNDVLMEKLADAGDGQYAYVDEIGEATRVLRENITGLLQVIARDTKAQIEFNPEIVERYRLIGYENRDVRDADFRNNAVDAGEIGAGHEVTVLYEVKLKDRNRQGELATVRLRYEKPEGGRFVELEEIAQVNRLEARIDDAPADLIFDACVAEFAEILRGSYWAKESTLPPVLDLARGAIERMTSRPDLDEIYLVMQKAAAISRP